ncbi:hypothetical protein KGY79_07405 [Candidatus Bipolaricaulota bacterium]|nr:hypothetical protein [Candidatus Bipolaricaulota bacterium]
MNSTNLESSNNAVVIGSGEVLPYYQNLPRKPQGTPWGGIGWFTSGTQMRPATWLNYSRLVPRL